MTKAQRLAEYREKYPEYHITGVKSMNLEQIDWYKKWGKNSLDEVYANPSEHKRSAWDDILRTYSPMAIIAVQGSSQTFSVLLKTHKGVLMHITKDNNYLVEVV